MNCEVKGWRAAKRLGVSLKFLLKLRVEGVVEGWRHRPLGDWCFYRAQIESLRTVHYGEYNTQDVALVLRVSERTVLRMVVEGRLPDRRFVMADGRKLGRLRFQISDMESAIIREGKPDKDSPKGEMLNEEKGKEVVSSHRM